jgi:hypothetical protein
MSTKNTHETLNLLARQVIRTFYAELFIVANELLRHNEFVEAATLAGNLNLAPSTVQVGRCCRCVGAPTHLSLLVQASLNGLVSLRFAISIQYPDIPAFYGFDYHNFFNVVTYKIATLKARENEKNAGKATGDYMCDKCNKSITWDQWSKTPLCPQYVCENEKCRKSTMREQLPKDPLCIRRVCDKCNKSMTWDEWVKHSQPPIHGQRPTECQIARPQPCRGKLEAKDPGKPTGDYVCGKCKGGMRWEQVRNVCPQNCGGELKQQRCGGTLVEKNPGQMGDYVCEKCKGTMELLQVNATRALCPQRNCGGKLQKSTRRVAEGLRVLDVFTTALRKVVLAEIPVPGDRALKAALQAHARQQAGESNDVIAPSAYQMPTGEHKYVVQIVPSPIEERSGFLVPPELDMVMGTGCSGGGSESRGARSAKALPPYG